VKVEGVAERRERKESERDQRVAKSEVVNGSRNHVMSMESIKRRSRISSSKSERSVL
jgi:hypothetical protein